MDDMDIKIADFSYRAKSVVKKLKKYKYVLVVLAAGIIILLMPLGSGNKSPTGKSQELRIPAFSLEEQERKMEEALSKIEGAGKVTVMLTLKSDLEQQIAYDVETDLRTDDNGFYESDSRSKVVTFSAGSGRQSPITVKYIYPCYQGALVITQSTSPEVKLQIVNAVAALTGLSTDRITVVKGT